MGSYANAPSGNPYGPLLEQIYSVLTTDVALLNLVPADNIGMNMRKSLQYPAIEFGLELASFDRRFRDTPRIALMVYGTDSPEDTVLIADTAKALFTPKNLTNVSEGVIVPRVACARHAILPRDDYGVSISMSFSMKYTFHKD